MIKENKIEKRGPKKGYKQTLEHIEKRIVCHRGMKRSEQTKAKLKVKWANRSKEERSAISRRTVKTRRQRGFKPWNVGKIGIYSKETRDKISKAKKGKKLSNEHRANISKSHLGKPNPHSEQWSINWKKAYRSLPEERKREWRYNNAISCQRKPNGIELKVFSYFEELFPGEYALNVRAEYLTIGGKIPDIVSLNQKKVIEFNGDYWHQSKRETQKRVRLFKKYGYKVLVLSYVDLRNLVKLKEKILKFFHSSPSSSK